VTGTQTELVITLGIIVVGIVLTSLFRMFTEMAKARHSARGTAGEEPRGTEREEK
jgi:hypothetical protein